MCVNVALKIDFATVFEASACGRIVSLLQIFMNSPRIFVSKNLACTPVAKSRAVLTKQGSAEYVGGSARIKGINT